MNTNIRKHIARYCIFCMAVFGCIPPVSAGMLPPEAAMDEHAATVGLDSRTKVQAFLQREEVRQQLADLGVDSADIEERIAALTDAEVDLLAEHMDEQPAGGLLAVIGVVFIVLLILELVGVTDIFKSVGPARTH